MSKYETTDHRCPECGSQETYRDVTRDTFYCGDCNHSVPIDGIESG